MPKIITFTLIDSQGNSTERIGVKALAEYFGSIHPTRLRRYVDGVSILPEESQRILDEISRQPPPPPGRFTGGSSHYAEVNEKLKQIEKTACSKDETRRTINE